MYSLEVSRKSDSRSMSTARYRVFLEVINDVVASITCEILRGV